VIMEEFVVFKKRVNKWPMFKVKTI
jgi:hypothetical protein